MAQKPAIFFSHSSKDKKNIVALKNALDRITGGTLAVFLSSDGQSIRFGTNWVHSIEDGLKRAEIMFVFVTPNSLQSDWIYFEAGYAYHKGIDVIPVGLGIDIGLLKPPLNLMQGFNLSSIESLNNIVTIINRKCDFTFASSFAKEEYEKICDLSTHQSDSIWPQYVERITMKYGDSSLADVDTKFCLSNGLSIYTDYLKSNGIEYSLIDNSLLFYGIFMKYIDRQRMGPRVDNKLSITISPYNLQKSFKILQQIIKITPDNGSKEFGHIQIEVKDKYNVINSNEKISSIILDKEDFSLLQGTINNFQYKTISFYIHPLTENGLISICFPTDDNCFSILSELLQKLIHLGIIYKSE